MRLRPLPSLLVAAAGLGLAGSAHALTCRSGIYNGTVEFRCSQPENITSSCKWSATLEAEDGSSGVRAGTFLLPPRSTDVVVVSENRFGGKKIVRGQVKIESCAVGLIGPAASDAAKELAKAKPPLPSAATQASATAAASAPRPSREASKPAAR